MNSPLTIWVGAIITITVLSFLIKDNVFYRIAQRAAMGAGIGIGIVITWQQVLYPYWWANILKAMSSSEFIVALLWLSILIPGALWYFQMSKKFFWLSKPVVGLYVGVAAGLCIKGTLLLILPQVGATLKPVNPFVLEGGLTLDNVLTCINNFIFVAGFLLTLFYFCYTVKAENRFFKGPMKASRIVIMLALGAMFGNTVMTRMAFLIERFQFLYQVWLKPFFGG